MARSILVSIVLVLLGSFGGAEPLRGGVAVGFPPYQYIHEGKPSGLDVELTEAILKEAGAEVSWTQESWDDLTALLRLTRDLDFLVGMEKTEERSGLYLLGRTLYTRRNLLFVLEKNTKIRRIEDLYGLTVARDRDAYPEKLLRDKGLIQDIRLVRTGSKEEAFSALTAGWVVAAFMPEAVGWTLSEQTGIAVRAIDFGDPGTPVGLAFRKGDRHLALRLDAAAERLETRGELRVLVNRWIAPRFSSTQEIR